MRKPEDFHGEKTFSGAAVSDFLPVGFLDAPTPTQGEMALYINNAWFLLRKMSQEAIVEWSTIRLMVKWRQVQVWRMLQQVLAGSLFTDDNVQVDKRIGELSEEIFTAGNILIYRAMFENTQTSQPTNEQVIHNVTLVRDLPQPDKERVIEAQDRLNGLELFSNLEAISQGIYQVHKKTVQDNRDEDQRRKDEKQQKRQEKSSRRRTRRAAEASSAAMDPSAFENFLSPEVLAQFNPTPAPEQQVSGAPIFEAVTSPPPADSPPPDAGFSWKSLKTHGIPRPPHLQQES